MKKKPFKFGSIVDEPYFTNRKEEIKKVRSILNSENHLIIISPRRFGKISLVFKVVNQLNRPVVSLDPQLLTSTQDFSAQLLKRVYRIYPFEKIRQFIKQFRIIPSISVNPYNNEVDISFQPSSSSLVLIEDVLNLIEKLSSPKKKGIIIFDEFQEVLKIEKHLPNQLRSVMQYHQNINYVFLGSQESLIREIFEKKKSPFYHFGILLPLDKIPQNDFYIYLNSRFSEITEKHMDISKSILDITGSHPYYTQQLAFTVWEVLNHNIEGKPVEEAINELVHTHDIDYERLWNTLNKTDMKILIGLSLSNDSPLSLTVSNIYNIGATSTAYSSLKRLMQSGFISKLQSGYEIDDPFFKRWIKERRLK